MSIAFQIYLQTISFLASDLLGWYALIIRVLYAKASSHSEYLWHLYMHNNRFLKSCYLLSNKLFVNIKVVMTFLMILTYVLTMMLIKLTFLQFVRSFPGSTLSVEVTVESLLFIGNQLRLNDLTNTVVTRNRAHCNLSQGFRV